MLKLSNANFGGALTADFMTAPTQYANLALDLGSVPTDGGPREVNLSAWVGAASHDTLWQQVNTVDKLLREAEAFRKRGLGRRVTLEVTPDGATKSTYYDVLRGSWKAPDLTTTDHLLKHWLEPLEITLLCEPLARGAEVATITGGDLAGQNIGVTHHYLHYTGATVFGTNNVSRIEGSLWQSDRLTATPTLQTPQNGDILYWGNNRASTSAWDRIVMGIRTARTGTVTAAWEFWNGSAWTAFTPTSTFRSGAVSTEFNTAANLGEVSWAGQTLTGWAATTINGVSALWVRWRITAFTNMPVVPVMMNGPFRSHAGLAAIASTVVKGDFDADALVHLAVTGGDTLAGVRAAIATGELSDYAPPFVIDLEAADLYAPSSGDIAVATSAPSDSDGASGSSDVAITMGATLATVTDRAQRLTGGQYITAAVSSGDKIDNLPDAKSFFVEVGFKLNSITNKPTPLLSRWSTSASTRCWWFGIDQGKLRAITVNSSGTKKNFGATTVLATGVWYVGLFKFSTDSATIAVYLDGVEEVEGGAGTSSLRIGQTIALRSGVSFGYTSADSIFAASAEVSLDADISYIWVVGESLRDTFGSQDAYTAGFPLTTKRTAALSSASAQLLWEMDDYAAAATLEDDGAGTDKDGTRTVAPTATNAAANAQLGYFASGIQGRALGIRLPQCYGQEYAGSYRVLLLAAPPASGFTDLAQVEFQLQFNVGDLALPFSTAPRRFPDLNNIRGSSCYYVLDMGVVTLAPTALYDGHRATDSARNQLAANLYVQSSLAAGSIIYVDCLIFLPADTWYGEYTTFRSTYDTAYALASGAGALFDGRGTELVIGQTTTSGYQYQDRNPYASFAASRPKLVPGKAAWLYALPLAGNDLTVDSLSTVLSGGLSAGVVPRVSFLPRFRALASP